MIRRSAFVLLELWLLHMMKLGAMVCEKFSTCKKFMTANIQYRSCLNQQIHCALLCHELCYKGSFLSQILMNVTNSAPVIKYVPTQLGPMNARVKKAMSSRMVQPVKVPLPTVHVLVVLL